MTFWADESVDFPIITELREGGHILKSVLEKCPGIADEEVLGLAVQDKNVLLTCDKDFGELIYRHKKTHCGIILIRLESLKSVDKAKLVSKIVTDRNLELEHAFTVIGEKFIRIRK